MKSRKEFLGLAGLTVLAGCGANSISSISPLLSKSSRRLTTQSLPSGYSIEDIVGGAALIDPSGKRQIWITGTYPNVLQAGSDYLSEVFEARVPTDPGYGNAVDVGSNIVVTVESSTLSTWSAPSKNTGSILRYTDGSIEIRSDWALAHGGSPPSPTHPIPMAEPNGVGLEAVPNTAAWQSALNAYYAAASALVFSIATAAAYLGMNWSADAAVGVAAAAESTAGAALDVAGCGSGGQAVYLSGGWYCMQ
jgi:hypothetical protein